MAVLPGFLRPTGGRSVDSGRSVQRYMRSPRQGPRIYSAVSPAAASGAGKFRLRGGEQRGRGAPRTHRNSGSLHGVIATAIAAVAAAESGTSKETKQRSAQTVKPARVRRHHTEPPGTRFPANHSRAFVHLRLILGVGVRHDGTTREHAPITLDAAPTSKPRCRPLSGPPGRWNSAREWHSRHRGSTPRSRLRG